MASIRCKACGKTYDYRKEGFCPKCGAYNRPPRQEWVDAEGTVHYAGQEKECYERKECHEEKVCYEEQTRRPKPYIRHHVPKKGIIGAVIAVVIVIMAINLPRYTALNFGSLVGGKEELTPNYPDYGWEQEAPAEEIESTVRGVCGDRRELLSGGFCLRRGESQSGLGGGYPHCLCGRG